MNLFGHGFSTRLFRHCGLLRIYWNEDHFMFIMYLVTLTTTLFLNVPDLTCCKWSLSILASLWGCWQLIWSITNIIDTCICMHKLPIPIASQATIMALGLLRVITMAPRAPLHQCPVGRMQFRSIMALPLGSVGSLLCLNVCFVSCLTLLLETKPTIYTPLFKMGDKTFMLWLKSWRKKQALWTCYCHHGRSCSNCQ